MRSFLIPTSVKRSFNSTRWENGAFMMNLKNVNHSNRFDVSGLLALDINRNMILISNEHVSKYFTMIVHSLDKFMKAFYKTRIYKDFR